MLLVGFLLMGLLVVGIWVLDGANHDRQWFVLSLTNSPGCARRTAEGGRPHIFSTDSTDILHTSAVNLF
jgi:hypothetical protein